MIVFYTHWMHENTLLHSKPINLFKMLLLNNMFIFQSCIKAMGVAWHSHHFRCVVCQTNLATESSGYHEHQVNHVANDS